MEYGHYLPIGFIMIHPTNLLCTLMSWIMLWIQMGKLCVPFVKDMFPCGWVNCSFPPLCTTLSQMSPLIKQVKCMLTLLFNYVGSCIEKLLRFYTQFHMLITCSIMFAKSLMTCFNGRKNSTTYNFILISTRWLIMIVW